MTNRRIGPRMQEVAAIARARPGIVQRQLALALTYRNGGGAVLVARAAVAVCQSQC